MNYVRSPILHQSLSLDGQPLDALALAASREDLVKQFNEVVGPPGLVIAAMQKDFIVGKMPFDEMVSYVRYCEYMISNAVADGLDAPTA